MGEYRGQDVRTRGLRGTVNSLRRSEAVRFLAVGVLSFLVDFGLLVVLHEAFAVPLAIATPIAFLTSLLLNFALQRLYAFRAKSHVGASAAKYLALVAFNAVAASFIVAGSEGLGVGYEIGKVVSTALMTVWNFFLYRYWIFTPVTSRPVAPR